MEKNKNIILKKLDSGLSIRTINTNNLKKCTLLILFMFSVCHTYSQSKYLIKDKEGFDFILNVTVDENIIKGFTREKALLDYASKFNYQIIKLTSSLKHPEIIRFNATLTDNGFEGTYDYLFSSYRIVGNFKQDSISYSLFDKNNKLRRSFKGIQITEHTKKDFVKLTEDIIKITEENIFDPKIIQSKKWRNFKEKIRNAAPKISDDLEFQAGFFALTRKIGFSHFYVYKNVASTDIKREEPSLKEIDKNTVLLKINSFTEKKENIEPLLDSILQKSYSTLIVDLRDNGGGNFESTFLVANFLTDKKFISGFFPGRNWYEEYDRLPNKNDIEKFSLMDSDTVQTDSKYGFYISTKETENNFKGETYFFVNKKTGSSAEALTIGAKEYNLAKIIGEKTSGALLMPKSFKIDEDIMLLVPTHDFISYNGYRVDQKGIKPDIETKKKQKLETLIGIIKKDN